MSAPSIAIVAGILVLNLALNTDRVMLFIPLLFLIPVMAGLLMKFRRLRPPVWTAIPVLMACCGLLAMRMQDVDEDLGTFLMAADLALIWLAFFEIHYPQGSARYIPSLVRSVLKVGVLISTCLYLIVLIFPDVRFRASARVSRGALGFGFGTGINPGDFSEVAGSRRLAFRVRFRDAPPERALLYWRGYSLAMNVNGLRWERNQGTHGRPLPETYGGGIKQSILLEPRFGKVLFALDRPRAVKPAELSESSLGPGLLSDGAIENDRYSAKRLLYDVDSQFGFHDDPVTADNKRLYLQVPRLDPRIKDLAREWGAAGVPVRQAIKRGMDFFSHGFQYRTDPGTFENDALAEFLFERREGFCEHFAASFATIMRAAGYPARVVVGFQGGERNPYDGTWLVRDGDAHAWAEVWSSEEKKWLRVDPTMAAAPLRFEQSAFAFSNIFVKAFRWIEWSWDAMYTRWNLYWMTEDRLISIPWLAARTSRIVALVLVIGILLASTWVWRSWSRYQRDPAAELYSRYCKRLAWYGIERKTWEGPISFFNRCENNTSPELAQSLREFTHHYVLLAYAPSDRRDRTSLQEAEAALAEVCRQLPLFKRMKSHSYSIY